MKPQLKVVKEHPKDTAAMQLKPCPYCATPAAWNDNPFRPFCSERCRTLDLGAWANEDYRVPVNDPVHDPYNEES